MFPDLRTVIDIGGQDAKVIALSPSGKMVNFVMNDKCAAGTGRFLDVMARVLEVRVEDLGDLGDKSTKEIGISSTCTVFAESEVISQLAVGTDKCDIIAGIHRSVAGRVSGLCNRVGGAGLSLRRCGPERRGAAGAQRRAERPRQCGPAGPVFRRHRRGPVGI